MKNTYMNISHFLLVLFNLKIFDKIVIPFLFWKNGKAGPYYDIAKQFFAPAQNL